MRETIQQRLKQIRGSLKQREFAEKLGMFGDSANRLISAYETGQARAQDDYLKKISEVFGQSYDELLAMRNVGDQSAVREIYQASLSDAEFVQTIERVSALCMERGHRQIARALLDFLDDLETASAASEKANRAAGKAGEIGAAQLEAVKTRKHEVPK